MLRQLGFDNITEYSRLQANHQCQRRWVVGLAETQQNGGNEGESRSAAAVQAAAPSSLAFTIDFGQNSDKPEITDNWKHLTPYRVHAGVQQRSSATKSRSANKQQTDPEIAGRKTNKV